MRRTAVHILKAIRFILFPDDSFTKGQLSIFVTGHWRILSYVCPIFHPKSIPMSYYSLSMDIECGTQCTIIKDI